MAADSAELYRTTLPDLVRFLHRKVWDLERAKDLAQVASTLVSLSSFQKRMSFERETVGGPIDVAVISKGDGFIWIDRKHYFRSDLNQHFFENYFNNVPADEGKNGRISNKKIPNVDGENN